MFEEESLHELLGSPTWQDAHWQGLDWRGLLAPDAWAGGLDLLDPCSPRDLDM